MDIVIHLNDKDTILCADDKFLYSHDYNRLYVALSIAISESIQYLIPMATDNKNGILLWVSIIEHLFGSTYKDILEATDKLRRWSIDPSKNLRSNLHTLSILITRVNETSKASFPESSIITIIYMTQLLKTQENSSAKSAISPHGRKLGFQS